MYIYGKNACLEALNNEDVEQAFLYKNFNDKDVLKKIMNKKIKTKKLEKKDMDNICNDGHQGIILEVSDYHYTTLEKLFMEDVIVMLDHLEDPHNFGAIIRTCEAAGVGGIIIPKDRSVRVNGTVTKVSVGTSVLIKIAMVSNLVNTLKVLKNNGYWIIGTDMKGTDFKKIDYSGKIVIVIGNENRGLSRLVYQNCDYMASIPMRGEVNSLNASVAGALIIYEAVRNR